MIEIPNENKVILLDYKQNLSNESSLDCENHYQSPNINSDNIATDLLSHSFEVENLFRQELKMQKSNLTLFILYLFIISAAFQCKNFKEAD